MQINNNIKEQPANISPDNFDRGLIRLLRWVLIFITLFVATFFVTGWGIYRLNWQNSFSNSVARVIPYPAAIVNYTNWISFNDYNQNIQSIRKYLESKEAAYKGSGFDFSTDEGLKRLAIIKKNVLNQLIENRIIRILAEKRGIKVSDAELSDTTNKILARDNQEKENLTQLSLLYGWGSDDFQKRVVKDLLYRDKLEEYVKNQGELDKNAKVKLQTVLDKIKNGEDFAEVAKEFSESPSKEYGGLLPAFTKEEAPENFANVAFSIPVGKISDPIEGTDGWHIVKIEKKFEEGGKTKVELRNIFINRDTLDDWLKNQKKQFRVYVPLSDYFWHPEMGRLYFKDESLNQLEEKINRATIDEKLQEADFLLNVSKPLSK